MELANPGGIHCFEVVSDPDGTTKQAKERKYKTLQKSLNFI